MSNIALKLNVNLVKLRNYFSLLLVLISPPVVIAVERGQFEIVLLALLIVGGFLLHAKKIYLAYLIFGVLSILKIYPIIIFILILTNRSLKQSIYQLIFGLVIFFSSLLIIWSAISAQSDNLPSSALSTGFFRTFGITVLPFLSLKFLQELQILDSELTLSLMQVRSLGVYITVILLIGIYLALRKKGVFGPNFTSLIIEESLRSKLTQLSLAMVYVCYFLVSSYDYRMIYLIPLFLVGLTQDSSENHNKLGVYLVYGIVLAMWAQVLSWTSAFVQIPILVTLILVLRNIIPIIKYSYLGPR